MKTPCLIVTVLSTFCLPLAALPFDFGRSSLNSRGSILDASIGQRMGARTPDCYSSERNVDREITFAALPLLDTDAFYCGVMGDFNADGSVDVAAVVRAAGQADNMRMIVTCWGNATGYHAGPRYAFSTTPSAGDLPLLRTADMDNDGDLDILYIVGRHNPVHEVSWIINMASQTGMFTSQTAVMGPVTPGNGVPRVLDAVAIHANSDRLMDVMIADAENDRISTWTGGTTGLFTLSPTFITEDTPNRIWAMDMDRDGRMDLVSSSGDILDGANKLSAPATRRLAWRRHTLLGWEPAALIDSETTKDVEYLGAVLTDIDDDGTRDFVFSRVFDKLTPGGALEYDASILYRRGIKGNPGAYAAAQVLQNFDSQARIRGLAAGDPDVDGDEDLLVTYRRDYYYPDPSDVVARYDNIRVHGESTGIVTDLTGTLPSGDAKLATADINGDTWPDLVASSPGGHAILWYPGRATGGFGAPVSISTGTAVPSCVGAGDVDVDGDADIVWAVPASGEIRRAANGNGAGTSWSQVIVATLPGLTWLTAANSNADKDLDLIAITSSGSVTWLNNNSFDGTWAQDTLPSVPGAAQVIAANFVENPRTEVAIVANSPGSMQIREFKLLNAPPWQPVFSETSGGGGSSAGVTSGDFNRDGWLDCAWASGNNTIRWITPTIAGAATEVVGTASGTVNTLRSLDWNRDGYADILCAHSAGLSVWISRPAATEKWEHLPLLTTGNISDAVPMHIDHDALMDVAAFDSTAGRIKIINHATDAQVNVSDLTTGSGVSRAGNGEIFYALRLFAINLGRQSFSYPYPHPGGTEDDANAIPERFRMRFVKAVLVGGGWDPGSSLTQAEFAASVDKVLIIKNTGPTKFDETAVVLAEVPATISGGYMNITIPAAADYEDSDPASLPGESYYIALRLKPVISAATTGSFFVQLAPTDASVGTRFVTSNHWPDRTPLNTITTPSEGQRVQLYTSYENWRHSWFETWSPEGNAWHNADGDSDGLTNLAEYMLDSDPSRPSAFKALTMERSAGGNIVYVDLPSTVREDGIVILQESSDLSYWSTYAQRTGTGTWTGAPHSTIFQNGFHRTTFAPPAAARKYYRLKFSLIP